MRVLGAIGDGFFCACAGRDDRAHETLIFSSYKIIKNYGLLLIIKNKLKNTR